VKRGGGRKDKSVAAGKEKEIRNRERKRGKKAGMREEGKHDDNRSMNE
jgi:hypothetical protein